MFGLLCVLIALLIAHIVRRATNACLCMGSDANAMRAHMCGAGTCCVPLITCGRACVCVCLCLLDGVVVVVNLPHSVCAQRKRLPALPIIIAANVSWCKCTCCAHRAERTLLFCAPEQRPEPNGEKEVRWWLACFCVRGQSTY